MLAFITSLRHPDNSDSYERVEALLESTLHSVTSQTSEDFVVIVVGHKPPSFPLPRNVTFIPVGFPPPVAENGPHAGREAFVWDKGTKIGIGLLAARAYAPDRVMIFDADDFVNRDLVQFSGSHKGDFGWIVRQGLMYSSSRNAFRQIDDFNRTCGTCAIVPFSAYAVPEFLTVEASQAEVGQAFGERLWRILGAHREAEEWFTSNGVSMRDLPFPGAVYHVDTGENHSGKALTGVAVPLTVRTSRQFGIRPSRGVLHTWWLAVGLLPVFESVGRKLRVLGQRMLGKSDA